MRNSTLADAKQWLQKSERCTTLNTAIGTRQLCAWQPEPGITWIQTRSPQFARELSQPQDSHLVARGVAGGYSRTFECPHALSNFPLCPACADDGGECKTKKHNRMKFADAYKGSYLKAADLGGKTLRQTIEAIQMGKIGDEERVVVSFKEKDQKLVLNKTNATILRDAWGDEMDDWVGKPVLLKPDRTTYQGKLVDCIRVAPVVKNASPPAEHGNSDDVNF